MTSLPPASRPAWWRSRGPGSSCSSRTRSSRSRPAARPPTILVSGRDIRTLVEELWLAGAEAIAVNGERITAATAIIDIGGSVLVNSAYLAPPYQVDGDRAVRPVRPPVRLGRLSSTSSGAGPGVRDPPLVRRAVGPGRPRLRRHVTLRYGRAPAAPAPAAGCRPRPRMPGDARSAEPPRAHRSWRSCSGFLVVVQLRAQGGGTGLETCPSRSSPCSSRT